MSRLPHTIETERLLLRQVEEADAEAIHAELVRSYDVISPWLDWLIPDSTLEDRVEFCKRAYNNYKVEKGMTVALWVKDCGQIAGLMDIRDIDWNLPSGEIGYWGSSATQGQGYISEAARVLSDHFIDRLGFVRIFLTCDSQNSASQRVAEHSGFALEGRLKNARRTRQGAISDTLIYGKVHAQPSH